MKVDTLFLFNLIVFCYFIFRHKTGQLVNNKLKILVRMQFFCLLSYFPGKNYIKHQLLYRLLDRYLKKVILKKEAGLITTPSRGAVSRVSNQHFVQKVPCSRHAQRLFNHFRLQQCRFLSFCKCDLGLKISKFSLLAAAFIRVEGHFNVFPSLSRFSLHCCQADGWSKSTCKSR